MLSTLFTAYIMCLGWGWATDSVMCSDGMCVPVGKHSGGSWKPAPSGCWSAEGVGVGLGRCPWPHVQQQGSGWGSPGQEYGKKPGENSAELSSPVGNIEYNQGQDVWRPLGGWTDGFLTPLLLVVTLTLMPDSISMEPL